MLNVDDNFIERLKEELRDRLYTYVESMNKGGEYAELFFVFNQIEKELRVLKLYKEPIDNTNRDYYMNDVEKLIKFKHDNLVKIYDKGFFRHEGNEYLFIILEYVKGSSLEEISRDLFQQGSSYQERVKYFLETLDGVQIFRKQFKYHKDLHRGNIILSEEVKIRKRKIKIIDPGSSDYFYDTGDDDVDLSYIKGNLEYYFTPEELKNLQIRVDLNTINFLQLRELIESELKEERVMLIFQDDSIEFILNKKLKKIYNGEELNDKLEKIRDSLYQDIKSIPEEIQLNESEKEKISDLASRLSGSRLTFHEISEKDWEEYNKKVDSYIDGLRRFLQERKQYFEELNEIITIDLKLYNKGKEMATDIDVYLKIPQPCEFVETLPSFHLEPPKIPKKPKPSLLRKTHPLAKVGEYMAELTKSLTPSLSNSIYSLGATNSPRNYSIENEQTLNIHCEKLKQGYLLKLEKIRIKKPSIADGDKLVILSLIVIGTPSKTFKDRLTLKIDTHS